MNRKTRDLLNKALNGCAKQEALQAIEAAAATLRIEIEADTQAAAERKAVAERLESDFEAFHHISLAELRANIRR